MARFEINTTQSNASILLHPGSGNVGIGLDSPSAKLHVKDGDVLIQGGTGTTSVSELGFTNAFDTAFLRSSYTNPSSTTETYIAFHTNTSGATNGTVAEQMRIAGNKVGIGTNAPTQKLEIVESSNYKGIHIRGSVAPSLSFGRSATTTQEWKVGISGVNGNNFAISTGTGSGEKLVVDTSGNVGIGTTAPQAQLQVKQLGINVNQSSVASTSQYQCDSMSATVFRSAKYTIQITNTTDSTYHVTELLLIHDGTTPAITEYGTIFTGAAAEATFDADIVSGNVRLLATPASSDTMQFKVVRHSILV